MRESFNHGLFGCFDNCTLCIISYLVPCWTVGRTAGRIGESCLCKGLLTLVPFLNIFIICQQRGTIRRQQDIRGGPLRDAVYSIFCPFCVVIQSAQESKEMDSQEMDRA